MEDAPDEAEDDEVEPAAFLDLPSVVAEGLRAEPEEAEEAAASAPALDDLDGIALWWSSDEERQECQQPVAGLVLQYEYVGNAT